MKLTPIIACIPALGGAQLVLQDGRMYSFFHSEKKDLWVAVYSEEGRSWTGSTMIYNQVSRTGKSLVQVVVEIALG